jgi:hypothetical protein
MAFNSGSINGYTMHGRPNLANVWAQLLGGSQKPNTVVSRGAIARRYETENEEREFAPQQAKREEFLTIAFNVNKTEHRFHRIVTYEKEPTISLSAINTNVPTIEISNVKVQR